MGDRVAVMQLMRLMLDLRLFEFQNQLRPRRAQTP